ncbi:MAG: hypothetical protein J5629_10440 [Muribaculaceae bacterium]|nr:hypothetical protein [Muribaculaceae bacterium]
MAQKTRVHVIIASTYVTIVLDMVGAHLTILFTGMQRLRFMDVNSIYGLHRQQYR